MYYIYVHIYIYMYVYIHLLCYNARQSTTTYNIIYYEGNTMKLNAIDNDMQHIIRRKP